jgi:hypothetical protein
VPIQDAHHVTEHPQRHQLVGLALVLEQEKQVGGFGGRFHAKEQI